MERMMESPPPEMQPMMAQPEMEQSGMAEMMAGSSMDGMMGGGRERPSARP